MGDELTLYGLWLARSVNGSVTTGPRSYVLAVALKWSQMQPGQPVLLLDVVTGEERALVTNPEIGS